MSSTTRLASLIALVGLAGLALSACDRPPDILIHASRSASDATLATHLCTPTTSEADCIAGAVPILFDPSGPNSGSLHMDVGVYIEDGKTKQLKLTFEELIHPKGCYSTTVDTTAGQVVMTMTTGCPLSITCAPASACSAVTVCKDFIGMDDSCTP